MMLLEQRNFFFFYDLVYDKVGRSEAERLAKMS